MDIRYLLLKRESLGNLGFFFFGLLYLSTLDNVITFVEIIAQFRILAVLLLIKYNNFFLNGKEITSLPHR